MVIMTFQAYQRYLADLEREQQANDPIPQKKQSVTDDKQRAKADA